MTWREKMQGVSQSNAEIDLWKEFQRRKLARPDTDHKIILRWTKPDFFWNEDQTLDKKPLTLYLDTPETHKDPDRDDWITHQLEARRMTVLRYSYSPPMSDSMRMKIADEIERRVHL